MGSSETLLPSLPLFNGLDYWHTFGGVLDRLIEQWCQEGWVIDYSGRRISKVALEVQQKGPTLDWSIVFDGDAVNYFAGPLPPEEPKQVGEWLQSVAKMKEGRAVHIRRINEDVLDAIAQCVSIEDDQIAAQEKPRSHRAKRAV